MEGHSNYMGKAILKIVERQQHSRTQRLLAWLFPRRRIWMELPKKSKIVLAIRK